MKKYLFMTAVSLLAFSASNAQAASATGEGTATAVIVGSVTVEQRQPMNFGSFLQGAGDVVLTPSGNRSGGDETKYVGEGSTGAIFRVSGPVGIRPTFVVPESAITIGNSGSDTMTVDTFVSNNTSVTEIPADGYADFMVGATLHVKDTQAEGTYTGNYQVTVNY